MFFLDKAWLVPLIPALSFVVILLFGKRMPRHGSEVGVVSVGASFVLACGARRPLDHAGPGRQGRVRARRARPQHRPPRRATTPKRRSCPSCTTSPGSRTAACASTAGIQIDGLAVMMMFVVTLISLLVHVYSLEYMRGDRRFTYFYAALSLFTASMLLLVVADNTLQLLVGWELVGVCSFMLIGHWWEEKPNSDAALEGVPHRPAPATSACSPA